ncbi:MAG: SMP-30/gluconolactonase/LRE family protein [Pseudomonadota bacterium]
MNTPQCVWNAHAALGEGPLWSVREQALYWVDILNHRLHRLAPLRQEQKSWQFDEEISAVAERAHHPGLIVTLRHGFAFFDPATGHLERLTAPEAHLPANRFNDGKCDRQGRLWAGTMDFGCQQPSGALYRLTADLACTEMDAGYVVTNGPAWSADQRTMYHNDSVNGRVYTFDFDQERGALSNKRVFLQFSEEDGSPDGMTTDAEGGLWIARWGAGKVTRHDAAGKVMQTIVLPCSQVTSCTFGGPALKTLYITTAATGLSASQLEREPLAGGLFLIEPGVAGLPANVFGG